MQDLYDCPYLDYYYSDTEKNDYLNAWKQKSKDACVSFTSDEYKVYEYISCENNHLDTIQIRHYLDEGCACQGCKTKRMNVKEKILNGEKNVDSIIHEDIKIDILCQRFHNMNNQKINNILKIRRKVKVGHRISLSLGISK